MSLICRLYEKGSTKSMDMDMDMDRQYKLLRGCVEEFLGKAYAFEELGEKKAE